MATGSEGVDLSRPPDAGVSVASVHDVLAAVCTEETAGIVASLIRVTGDWDLAEDAVQDATARALERWPLDGVPDKPGAWLTRVARNRAVDILRRRGVERAAVAKVALEASLRPAPNHESAAITHGLDDDRLRLIYTCCHPALDTHAQVALTLRTVAGLSAAQIARAFLVSEAAMEKRLVRTRARIRYAGIPYRVPPPHLLGERTAGVLLVVYLMFNEGYSGTGAPSLQREAIRVGRLLADLLVGTTYEPEALGLLALMQFHGSRAAARTDSDGGLRTLEDQDRAMWDHAAIIDGVRILAQSEDAAARLAIAHGPYQLQAAIAAEHATATTAAATNYHSIANLYASLAAIQPSPVIELNRAVAEALAGNTSRALGRLDRITRSGQLGGYYLLPAARADILRRSGQHAHAVDSYEIAIGLAPTDAERSFLQERLRDARSKADHHEEDSHE